METVLSRSEEVRLRRFALEIRRQTICELHSLGSGHIGGCMSLAETMAVLYGGVLRVDPEHPDWPEWDRLVVSKGHAGPVVYAALALRGFFPMDWLKTLNRPGTCLPSHTDANKTPGVDMTTGSLGQGVSAAVGIALANRLQKRSNHVYAIAGDGECDEGQVWEAALFAASRNLNNLTLLVDRNWYQLDGSTRDVLALGNLEEKFRSFGWNTFTVQDGHDISALYAALMQVREEQTAPTALILNTVKGKGYPAAMRGPNHHMVITDADYEEAMQALQKEERQLCREEGQA